MMSLLKVTKSIDPNDNESNDQSKSHDREDNFTRLLLLTSVAEVDPRRPSARLRSTALGRA